MKSKGSAMARLLVPQFLLLLAVVPSSLGQDSLCPPPEDLHPCICVVSGLNRIEVVCKEVDDVVPVRRALQSVKGIQQVSVRFQNCSLGVVPSDLFHGLHITELSFKVCNLSGIGNEGRSALEGLENTIVSLEVSFTEGKEPMVFPDVSKLGKLARLYVLYNNIVELDDDRFAGGPATLKNLDLYRNRLEKLGDRAFANLAGLQELWLGGNRVRAPLRSMLPSPAGNLHTLQLNDNGISILPVDLFSNMPALKTVFLGGNFLQRIPITTWTPVWSQLEVLNLDDNPIICDPYFEWTLSRRRAGMLSGKCVSPVERKGVDLRRVIDHKLKGRSPKSLKTLLLFNNFNRKIILKTMIPPIQNSKNV